MQEITVHHKGDVFVLVPYEQRRYLAGALVTETAYELVTEDYLPVRDAYGLRVNVGNIEYLRPRYHRAGGRASEGWGAPQLRSKACATPEEAAIKLLGWLERKAKKSERTVV
jgi:hypothetical protein